ncbi:hypothetical protein C8R43DRAFT_1036598 [Mycena crocata]|nr:hypothetical protein C8R43DRAFT_1036598 [Mycena crocata]
MQLRPGLGAGADGAWLVRFLMSFFGWFAVLVAGGREFSPSLLRTISPLTTHHVSLVTTSSLRILSMHITLQFAHNRTFQSKDSLH